MKRNTNLERNIEKITMLITAEFPDLIKHLDTIPSINPSAKHSDINKANLQEYYNSLLQHIFKYAPGHRYFKTK